MDIYSKDFYIYFYLREDYTPYYVGKGKGDRAWKKDKTEIKVPSDKSRIIIIKENISDLQAFILERYYIRWFGRKDNGTGILRNKTDGGEGVSPEDARKRTLEMASKGLHPFQKESFKLNNSLRQKELLKQGMHNSQISVNNKTHVFFKDEIGNSIGKEINKIRVQNGTHNLLGPNENLKRVQNGTHNWVLNKGTVPCYDKLGNYKRIPKEVYHSQSGDMSNWEWTFISSYEGKRRKELY